MKNEKKNAGARHLYRINVMTQTDHGDQRSNNYILFNDQEIIFYTKANDVTCVSLDMMRTRVIVFEL